MTPSDEAVHQEVSITLPEGSLDGSVLLPDGAVGLVLFAHGSGSGRFSPRNRFVAEQLAGVGIGVLLFDLLTREEQSEDNRTAALRFDIDLLTARLIGGIDWASAQDDLHPLPMGLFGASTGAAAALVAAAARPGEVRALVSRGGRPDLAGDALGRVMAPTLLIVGGLDEPVISLNREAAAWLKCEYLLEIVPGAGHLFEQPGTLEQVARLARDWFLRYLR